MWIILAVVVVVALVAGLALAVPRLRRRAAGGRRRVLRESQEVPRRVAEGTYRAARKADGAWQLS